MMRCDLCSAEAAVVEPGADGIHELFLLKREVPMRRWCLACWIAAFRVPVDEAAA